MKSMEEKRKHLPIPPHVEKVCQTLENAGFSAFVVGGCVRDVLLSKTPHDYDVATAARPEMVKKLFLRTHDTGISHGTVTVVTEGGPIEVTTFREDGAYSDNRRPDSVNFLSEIDGDLSRRDFTVNAIAYSPRRGLYDPFSGCKDLENRCLRTVGDPEKRFGEDALRILRLFRFRAQLSFAIEAETQKAALRLAPTLSHISRERIFAEITKLLEHADFAALWEARPIFEAVMPKGMLSEETCRKVADCPSLPGKWALLCGAHAMEILEKLRAPRALTLSAGELAAYTKGAHIVYDVAQLKHTKKEDFFAFLGDTALEEAWQAAKNMGAPTSLCEMAVSGRDMEEIGFRGRAIGEVLDRLFMYAIENPANNRKEKLWEEALWIYKNEYSKKA